MARALLKGDERAHRGIALVATLAVLTVLAILAAYFVIQMSIENSASQTALSNAQSEMLIQSALEHAKSLLHDDALKQPAWDDPAEPWRSSFAPDTKRPHDAANVDGLPASKRGQRPEDARWIYVRRDDGAVIGRYAVVVQDEAGKINANVASAVMPRMQGQGIGTSEIILTDGKDRGIPLSLRSAKRILRYRYGRDCAPGQAGVDDNSDNIAAMCDGLDNDADGTVDEPDEGIDEPAEYDPLRPRWDDRAFGSVNDVARACGIEAPAPQNSLKKYCTVHTSSRNGYWDDHTGKLQWPLELNVSTIRQMHKALRRANEENPFEGSPRNLHVMAANILDYRDENHVLSTLGNEYGVEAVCFNEIMANDGSFDLEADHQDFHATKYTFVHRFGFWYDNRESPPNYKRGWRVENITHLGPAEKHVLMEGKELRLPIASVRLSSEPIRFDITGGHYRQFRQILKDMHGWEPGMWRNAELVLWKDKSGKEDQKLRYPIHDNSDTHLQVCYDDTDDFTFDALRAATNNDVTVRIDSMWYPGPANWTVFPRQTDYWVFPTQVDPDVKRPEDIYYYVYIGEQNFASKIRTMFLHHPFDPQSPPVSRPWKGYNPYLDTDGKPKSDSTTRMEELLSQDLKGTSLELPRDRDRMYLLRTPYRKAEAIRARGKWLHVCLTSGHNTGYVGGMDKISDKRAFGMKNAFDAVYVMRPDIIELINVSDRPISLHNWRVVINTGDKAEQVGIINRALHYSADRHGRYDDPNPSILPGEYFYLTNNRNVFDREYGGGKDGAWGTSRNEEYPCFELPDALWGVRYEITAVRDNYIRVKGAKWRKDQMKNEMVEFQTTRTPRDRNGLSGVRRSVFGNSRNKLVFQEGVWVDDQTYNMGVKSGDDALILGLPRAGGFLSMTLKNEYGQITGRIIEYGSLKVDELTCSTQKQDPTHYSWERSRHPTFGGTEEKARNRGAPRDKASAPHVKNSRFGSVAEIQSVRSARDWENIGSSRRGKGSAQVLKAISKFFTPSGIRLDAEEEDAHVSGWDRAFGNAAFSTSGKLSTEKAAWQPDIWAHQKLRILSGPQRGETFLIIRNTESSIQVDGYSLPGGKLLHVNKGDAFSVGPGYATPFFYTLKEGEEGVWEWKGKHLEKTWYALYLAGLNDSIKTTELLEENNNAQLEVYIFNFATHEYDRLPLNVDGMPSSEFYARVRTKENMLQYTKSDTVYCGMIGPDHISAEEGIRLKLIPHGLNNRDCSGVAWFDYAYLTPGTEHGKLNVNTASERALRALKDITPELARNIRLGADSHNRNKLKPYKNTTDILDVKGMTPEIFANICNLITTRGDQYRVQILAQTLRDVDADGVFDENAGDTITANRTADFILDRRELTDSNPKIGQFRTLVDN